MFEGHIDAPFCRQTVQVCFEDALYENLGIAVDSTRLVKSENAIGEHLGLGRQGSKLKKG